MNLEVLKNDVRDMLVDGLIIGSNVVRWALHQFTVETPPTPASIQYFPDLHESEEQERRLE